MSRIAVDHLWRPFGVDFLCLSKKFIIYNFVGRNLKLKYRRSTLGLLWSLLVPTLTAFTYYFVFQYVARFQIPNYIVFLLTGLLPWTFFAQSVTEGMESVTSNHGLISKVPIPIQIFPFTATATNMANLLFSLPVVICFAAAFGLYPGISYVFLPLVLLNFFFMAYGLSLLLSIAFVFFRDLRHLIGILVQLWMFATPIMYTEAMIPNQFRWILWANPVASTVSVLRGILIHNQMPDPAMAVAAGVWGFVICLVATFVTARYQKIIPEFL